MLPAPSQADGRRQEQQGTQPRVQPPSYRPGAQFLSCFLPRCSDNRHQPLSSGDWGPQQLKRSLPPLLSHRKCHTQTDTNCVSGENWCFCCGEHSQLSGDKKQKFLTTDLKKWKLELVARAIILPLAEQLDGPSDAVSPRLWGRVL